MMFWRKHAYFTAILIAALSVILTDTSAEADVYVYGDLIVAGLTVLNTGAALVNGARLVDGDPSFTKGFGGFLIGSGTVAVITAWLVESDNNLGNRGKVLAGAGLAATVSGALSMILTDHKSFKPRKENRLSIVPSYDLGEGKTRTFGVEIRFCF
jgi:hypothetical protein